MKKINVVNGETSLDQNFFNTLQSNVEEVFNGEEPMGSIVVEDVIGKNLFDKNDNIQSGSFTDTGVIDTSSDKFVQLSYIPVESSKNYILHAGTVPDRLVICEYDSNKNFIKRNISLGTYTIPIATTSTTKYVRVCSGIAVLDTLQLEKGSTATEYTPYKKFGYNSQESMGKIVVDDISSKNLYNKNNLYEGYRFGSDGLLFAHAGFSATDFIPVTPSTTYVANWTLETQECICYYDETKTFISRNVSTNPFTTPTNCKYIRASRTTPNVSTAQIEKGDKATPYTPYKEFSNRQHYSTNEQIIGTWIDGRQLYRKTIECGALPNNDRVQVATGVTNVSYVKVEGVAIVDNFSIPLPFLSLATPTDGVQLIISGDVVNIKTSSNTYSAYTKSYVTIEYVKNTQTAMYSPRPPEDETTTEEGELDG